MLQFFQDLKPSLMTLADVHVTSLEQKIHHARYPAEKRSKKLESVCDALQSSFDRGSHALTAYADDRMVGYMLFQQFGRTNFYIDRMYTTQLKPSYPVGKSLLWQLIASKPEMTQLELTTEREPESIEKKHQSNGFVRCPDDNEYDLMFMPPEHLAMWRQAAYGSFPIFNRG